MTRRARKLNDFKSTVIRISATRCRRERITRKEFIQSELFSLKSWLGLTCRVTWCSCIADVLLKRQRRIRRSARLAVSSYAREHGYDDWAYSAGDAGEGAEGRAGVRANLRDNAGRTGDNSGASQRR